MNHLLPRLTLVTALVCALLPGSPALSAGPTLEEMSRRSRERAEALAGGSKRGDVLLEAGRRSLQEGDLPRAVELLLEARTVYAGSPAEPAVLLALGDAYAAQLEVTFARSTYDELIRRFPASELADDAQYGKARLELAQLPSPEDFLAAVRSFATFNPLSLDPDAIHHLLGVERSYRMDRIGEALRELELTWKSYPAGDRAPAALLEQAVLEGLLVSRRDRGLERTGTLLETYPDSAEAPVARVLEGFLRLMQGETAAAVDQLDRVPPGARVFETAAFLRGLGRAYILGDSEEGELPFRALARSADRYWRELGHYHLALLEFAATGRTEGARKRLESIGPAAESPRVDVWVRALLRTLDAVDEAGSPDRRRLETALFWSRAGHRGKAEQELTRLAAEASDPEAAAEARLELGRLTGSAQLLAEAAKTHPETERRLEAHWRGGEQDGLRALIDAGTPWKGRAAAELAKRLEDAPVRRGRLLRKLAGNASMPEERDRRLRDLADFLASQARHGPALDLYRRLLPADPSLRSKMIELAALRQLEETEPPFGAAAAPTLTLTRALEVTEALVAAGQTGPAKELLRKAAGLPGGAEARARLLVLDLREGPLDLAALGRVNELLEEAELRDASRHELIEWKARILEHQGVELEKALDLYGYLVSREHDADRLRLILAERRLEQGNPRRALTTLAKVPHGPRRDLIAARALRTLEGGDSYRDRLVYVATVHPESPEAAEALTALAEHDAARFRLALAAVIPAEAGIQGSSEAARSPKLAQGAADTPTVIPAKAGIQGDSEAAQPPKLARRVADRPTVIPADAGIQGDSEAVQPPELAQRAADTPTVIPAKAGIQGDSEAVQPPELAQRAADTPTVIPAKAGIQGSSTAGSPAAQSRFSALVEELHLLLDVLVPGEAARLAPELGQVADALAERSSRTEEVLGAPGSRRHLRDSLVSDESYRALLDRMIASFDAELDDPARLERLHALRLDVSTDPQQILDARLGRARALARAGDGRRAFEVLQGDGPRAQLEQARVLHGPLGDSRRAMEMLRTLESRPGVESSIRAEAARQLAVWTRGAEGEARWLHACVKHVPAGPDAAPCLERLAELALARGDREQAASHLEAAGELLKDTSRGWRLSLDACRIWLGLEQDSRASSLAARLLDSGRAEGVPDEAREILGVVAGRQRIESLRRALDLDDPEKAQNFENLLEIARAEVRLLGRPDAAEGTLLAVTEQFPAKAASEAVAALRKEIALRRTLERHRSLGAAGLLRAGLVWEESTGDLALAARDYGRAVLAARGTGPIALLARLYQARALALRSGDGSDARPVLEAAASQPEAALFGDLIESARAYLEPPAEGGWRARAAWALERVHDPAVFSAALNGASSDSATAAEMAYRGALDLDPLRSVTPLGPGREELLELAARLATSAEEKARAYLALGAWKRQALDPERALELLKRAEAAARGTGPALEAAALKGDLLEREMADPAGASDAYEALAAGAGPFQEIASARLPIVLARREAEQAEEELLSGEVKDAGAYLAAARRQSRRSGPQLEQALENYRTYLRVAGPSAEAAEAQRELAELLVRLDRSREAVETLARLVAEKLPGVDVPRVLVRIGEILETHVADLEEAERFYREVRRVAPDSEAVRDADAGLARIVEARAAHDRAREIGESSAPAGEELATIRKRYLEGGAKDPEGAVEALRAQIAQTDEARARADLYEELGAVQEKELKDFEGAVDSYRKAIADRGESDRAAELTLRMATVLSEHLQRPKDAFEVYEAWRRAYYAHPQLTAVKLEQARLLESRLDNAQRAIDIYRNIADAHPRSGHDEKALLRIAFLSRAHFADYLGAVAAYDEIARRFPFGPNAQDALLQAARVAELELGDLNRAIGFYNRLVQTYPTSPLANEARTALARIQRRLR